MSDVHTPSEYWRKYVQPMLETVWSHLEHFDFGSGMLDMTLSEPDNVSPKNEAYRKWYDDWIAVSKAVHESMLKVRELHDGMEGVISGLENQSAQWVIDPMETKAAG